MFRKARCVEQIDCHRSGERGLEVGFQHHRVASNDRRQEIGHCKRQRIVPRRDDTDDADRVAHFAHLRDEWKYTASLLVLQQSGCGQHVVTADVGDVEDLIHRTRARFAVLPLHDVAQCGLFLEDEIMELRDDRESLRQRCGRPCRLRCARFGKRTFDIGLAAVRNCHHRLHVERRRLRRAMCVRVGDDLADDPVDFGPVEVRAGNGHGVSVRRIRRGRR